MKGFRCVLPIEIRFRDMDALGHVNNVVYLTYMESARMQWWMQVTSDPDLSKLSMILARTEIDYRSQARYGDSLVCGARCESMRRSSFVLAFRVENAKDASLVAEARKVLVHYDYEQKRSTPIPERLRSQILAYDEGVTSEEPRS